MALLGLSMIVKDEEQTLERTLLSVRDSIDCWTIADTGSTDRTKEVIARALAGIPGEIVDIPFVDFATTRNRALDRHGEASDFVLWLDADDELVRGRDLREFLQRHARHDAAPHEAYLLRVESGLRFDSARVFRARSRWRFRGVVHEVLMRDGAAPASIRVPNVLVRHHRAGESAERSRRRWARDVELLRGALATEPEDARATFYLGQTLAWLERHDEAIEVLERRVAMGGWQEEVYQARMTLAQVAVSRKDPWERVQQRYLDAHSAAPHRAEPLHAIAFHYDSIGNYALTLLFARRGYELPMPVGDRLFVDEEVYRWKLADLVASSAYWIGAFELGEEAARRAVAAMPNEARLKQNLGYYTARRASRGAAPLPSEKQKKPAKRRR